MLTLEAHAVDRRVSMRCSSVLVAKRREEGSTSGTQKHVQTKNTGHDVLNVLKVLNVCSYIFVEEMVYTT